MQKTLLLSMLIGSAALGLANPAVQAQTGPLDPGFGTAGQVRTAITPTPSADVAQDVTVQPDGKIVVLGYGRSGVELVRYLPDGTLDASFGTGGKATSRAVPPTVGPSGNTLLPCLATGRPKKPQGTSLLQQPDGKLVVAGAVVDSTLFGSQALAWMVCRFLPNGQLDTSFGLNGLPYGKCGYSTGGAAYKVVRQSSGRLLAVGTDTGLNSRTTSVVALTANGLSDNSFSSTTLGDLINFAATDAVVDAQDRLWVVGTSSYMPSNGGNWTYQRLGLYRLLANGRPDTSFGTNGEVLLNVNGQFTTGKSIALLPSGNVVVVGSAQANTSSGTYYPFLASYTDTGTLAPAFGTAGIATISQQPSISYADLMVQSDGKLLVAGTNTAVYGRYSGVLSRWLPTGQPDLGYGLNGAVQVRDHIITALAMQPDDKAVVTGGGGATNASSGSQFVTSRVLPTTTCTQADAGASQTVCLGATRTVRLGSAANPSALAYNWTVSPTISGFAASTGNPVVSLPNVTATTTYVFTLAATGPGQCAPTDQVQVTVVPDIGTALHPLASPALANGGQTVTLSVPSPQPGVTYAWTGPGLLATTGPTVTAVPPATNNSARYLVTATFGACTSTVGVQVGVRVPGTPAWSWAAGQIGLRETRPLAVATDNAGNVYETGWFGDSTLVGTPYRLVGNSGQNLYVAKYDPVGTVLWAKRLNSLTTTVGNSIVMTVGPQGHIYLAGNFNDSIRVAGTARLRASDGNAFIARLTATGEVLWARNVPTPAAVAATSVGVASLRADTQGNIYLGGNYASAAKSYSQGCILKLEATGALIWFQALESASTSNVSSIDLDGTGNVALAGGGQGPFTFGALTLATTGSANLVGRLDAQQGTPQWLRPVFSGTAMLGSPTTHVATNAAGEVFLACTSWANSVTFAGATAAADLIVARSGRANDGEVFMAGYSASGTPMWAQRAGSHPGAISYSRGLQARGPSLYLTGYFSGPMNFGAVSLPSSSSYTAFVAKYAAATGANEWAQQSGSGTVVPAALAVDATGNCWLSGSYLAQGAGFGSYWLSYMAPFSGTSAHGFVARLSTSVGLTTGVVGSRSAAQLSLYPNPAYGTPVCLELAGAAGPLQVTVLSNLGQRVYHAEMARSNSSGKLSIPTQQLAPGLYLVRVQTAQGAYFGKVQVN